MFLITHFFQQPHFGDLSWPWSEGMQAAFARRACMRGPAEQTRCVSVEPKQQVGFHAHENHLKAHFLRSVENSRCFIFVNHFGGDNRNVVPLEIFFFFFFYFNVFLQVSSHDFTRDCCVQIVKKGGPKLGHQVLTTRLGSKCSPTACWTFLRIFFWLQTCHVRSSNLWSQFFVVVDAPHHDPLSTFHHDQINAASAQGASLWTRSRFLLPQNMNK